MMEDNMLFPNLYYNPTSSEKTFSFEENLPSLPVASLQQVLKTYIDSVVPHLSEEEFQKTKRIVKEFEQGIGRDLYQQLISKVNQSKNWLEKWWEEVGYLQIRIPHSPHLNFGSSFPYCFDAWPPKEGTQIERAALVTWYTLQFWDLLKKEKVSVARSNKNMPMSMFQFYRLFNGCKTPGLTMDKINHYFKIETEGTAPSFISVVCQGRYFILDILYHTDHSMLTPPEIEHQLRIIKNLCDEDTGKLKGTCIGAMTGDFRSAWHKNREYLISLDSENQQNLILIQQSIFLLTLDEASPKDYSQCTVECMLKSCRDRWYDKTINIIVFKNGMVGDNADHIPHDAMVHVTLGHFTHLSLKACNYRWKGPKILRSNLTGSKELLFKVDDRIRRAVELAVIECTKQCDSIELVVSSFEGYGKNFIRLSNFHPDAFFQMALQLAYYYLYNKPAPTYETATTRTYYHGRTETLRTCTIESLEFTRSIVSTVVSVEEKFNKFKLAHDKHCQNMDNSTSNKGCDRVLFAIKILAEEKCLPEPDLYKDKGYFKSGGGGNFILSTSLIGYTPISGGTAPMCKNGYGCFYNILSNRIVIFVSCWKEDENTACKMLQDNISRALVDLRELIILNKSFKISNSKL